MANFIYLNNYQKTGKLGISVDVFEQIAKNTLAKIPDISLSEKQMKKYQFITLNRPVQTSIKKGIVHVSVAIDIKKNITPTEACSRIQEEIVRSFMAVTDQVPFDVQVKVESII